MIKVSIAILTKTIAVMSKTNGLLLEVCRVISTALVGLITAVVCAGVFWRYVLNSSLSWSDELAKFLMVWLGFVGSPIAMRMGHHVAIALFPNLFSPRLRNLIMCLLTSLVVCFCSVLAYFSFLFALNGWNQVAVSIDNLSLFWIFISVPMGMALIVLVGLQQIFEYIADFISPGSVVTDAFIERHQETL